ncbi:MAG: hypothetical protein HS126_25265 [Anaerolineales bacterium]|nr:hypothetical protein [Anaerolineales bacterium]
MLDELLDLGCNFDWITPTFAFIQDWLNGPTADFGISAFGIWGRDDIRKLLTKHGIKVWGIMYNVSGDMIMFTVRKAQGKWAYYLLQREGVPILYAPTEVVYIPKTSSKDTDLPNPIEAVFNFLDKLENSF